MRRWTGLADAITQRLRRLPRFVISVDSKIPLDRLGTQALLFEKPGDLRQDVADTRDMIRQVAVKPDLLRVMFGNTPLERLLSGLAMREPPELAARIRELAERFSRATRSDAGSR